jgi:hypothetical protein
MTETGDAFRKRRRLFTRLMCAMVGVECLTALWTVTTAGHDWWAVLFPITSAAAIAAMWRSHLTRHPLCPKCGHLIAVHKLTTPDPIHTWGWVTCLHADDGCDCWATWSEGIAPDMPLHTTAEVHELIAQWVEQTGEAPR